MKKGYAPAWKSNGLEAAPEGAKRRYEAHFVSKLTDCDGLRLGAYLRLGERKQRDGFVARFRKRMRLYLSGTTHETYRRLGRNWPNVGRYVEKGRFVLGV